MRAIGIADYERFMERIRKVHPDFTYPEGRMDDPEHFMRDCIALALRPLGNPFIVAVVMGVDAQDGRLQLWYKDGGYNNRSWIDVEELKYWEPA